jgi:hypothetical protein
MPLLRNLSSRGAIALSAALLPRAAAAQMPTGSAIPTPSTSPASVLFLTRESDALRYEAERCSSDDGRDLPARDATK